MTGGWASDMCAAVKDLAHRHPAVFARLGPLNERAPFDRRVVRPGDDLVLEGYPRSANSFALQAFRMAQSRDMRIGNHCHSPMQLHLAARYGVPAVVVFRPPLDAVVSLLVFHGGHLSPRAALERYVRFHDRIAEVADAWVPVSMAEATGPMEVWITRINRRFGTDFAALPAEPDWQTPVRSALSRAHAARLRALGQPARTAATDTVPSDRKQAWKAQLRPALDLPDLADLRRQAQTAYDRIRSHPWAGTIG